MGDNTKIIVVIGATGNQGSSVVDTFLNLEDWHVRAITRNPFSEAALLLRARGAEVVQADLAEPATIPPSFVGAHTIFLNTDYWEEYRPLQAALKAEKKDIEPASHAAFKSETCKGKLAADAAAGVPNLQRFIVSSLGSASKGSGGKYQRSLHTESKAWIVDYIIREQPLLATKMSLIFLGAYNTNPFLTPKLDPKSGKYIFALPWKASMRIPTIAARASTGPFVRALVEDEAPGTKLLAYDSNLTAAEITEAWSRASGKETELRYISTHELHREMGVGWDHLDALDAYIEFGYCSAVDGLIEPEQLKSRPATISLDKWLQGRDWHQILATQ